MPLTVTKWPYHPDPRTAGFSIPGYRDGAVAPWQFLVTTTEAEAPFESFNTGEILTADVDLGGSTLYRVLGTNHRMDKAGITTPTPPPNEATVFFQLIFDPFGPDEHRGDLEFLFPPAIQQLVFDMVPVFPNPSLVPNPVVCDPRPWNFELP